VNILVVGEQMTVQKAVANRLTKVQKTKVALTMVVMVAETAVATATAVAEENPIQVVDVNTRRSDTYSRKQHSIFGLTGETKGVSMQTSKERKKPNNFHGMSDKRDVKKHNIWIPRKINAICEGLELYHWLR